MKYIEVIMIGILVILLAMFAVPNRTEWTAETVTEAPLEFETEPVVETFVVETTEAERVLSAKTRTITVPWRDLEEIHAEVIRIRKTRQIESEETNEQETGEESGLQSDLTDEGSAAQTEIQEVADAQTVEQADAVLSEAQNGYVPDASTAEVVGTVEAPQGDSLDNQPEGDAASTIPEILKASLDGAGIGWWYPYACAQIEQESHWNPWAVNSNNLDYGLLQYRISFWTEPEDIFDVNAQIRKYTQQVAARINAGLSVEEIISRHITSDYVTEINWEYVNAVLQWLR